MTSKWTAGPWKAETDNRIKHRQFVSSDERTRGTFKIDSVILFNDDRDNPPEVKDNDRKI